MSKLAHHSSPAAPQPDPVSEARGTELQSVAVSAPATSSDASLLFRLRVFLWLQHQPAIAGCLLACIAGMSAYFLHLGHVRNGLIEIDRSGSLQAEFQVDINQAQFGEIVVLPGVGEKLAQTIVEYRASNGPFSSVDSLAEVPGIGEKKLEALIPYLVPIDSDLD